MMVSQTVERKLATIDWLKLKGANMFSSKEHDKNSIIQTFEILNFKMSFNPVDVLVQFTESVPRSGGIGLWMVRRLVEMRANFFTSRVVNRWTRLGVRSISITFYDPTRCEMRRGIPWGGKLGVKKISCPFQFMSTSFVVILRITEHTCSNLSLSCRWDERFPVLLPEKTEPLKRGY